MNGFDALIAEFHRWATNWRWWMNLIAGKVGRDCQDRSAKATVRLYLMAAEEVMPPRCFQNLRKLMSIAEK